MRIVATTLFTCHDTPLNGYGECLQPGTMFWLVGAGKYSGTVRLTEHPGGWPSFLFPASAIEEVP